MEASVHSIMQICCEVWNFGFLEEINLIKFHLKCNRNYMAKGLTVRVHSRVCVYV